MGAFFTMLLAKIAAVVQWFSDLFVAIFVALWDILRDAWCWPFEQVMKIVKGAIESVDLSALNGYVSQGGALPAEIVNILQLLGIGTCVGIIVGAIGIRLVLQLIPFTRLGS